MPATTTTESPFVALELPRGLKDLEPLVHADLAALVSALSEPARERLLLTRRGYQALQEALWNRIAEAVNETMAPLTPDRQ